MWIQFTYTTYIFQLFAEIINTCTDENLITTINYMAIHYILNINASKGSDRCSIPEFII